MIDKVKTMKLLAFDGDNVSKATGQFRMAIKRIEVLNKVPIELNEHILTMLRF